MPSSTQPLKKTYAGRIRDPLYDLIEFDDTLLERTLWKAIQCSSFQRLRRIKQLGFSDYVYPGATHTRFAHSLGVFHTAKKLLQLIENILGKKRHDPNKAAEALAAALLHDIGHGPFSHAFERVIRKFNVPDAKHEAVSSRIVRDSEMTKILDGFYKGFGDNVADMIVAKGANIYSAVVSSQFDADRLDYMQRDRLMAGTRLSGIDMTWLLSNLEIGSISVPRNDSPESEPEQLQTFVLNKKASHAAQAYVLGLFQLYPTIYYHHTTRCLETMASQMLVRIFQLVRDNNIDQIGLPEKHPYVLFAQSPDELDRLFALDDTVIMGSLPMLMGADDGEIAHYARCLHRRIAYKCYDVSSKFEKIAGEIRSDLKSRANLSDDSTEEMVQKRVKERWTEFELEIKARLDSAGICHFHVFLDSDERSPYKQLDPDDTASPLNQMYTYDNKGQCVDFSSTSDIISAVKPFRFYRIYADRSANESLKLVEQCIEEKRDV